MYKVVSYSSSHRRACASVIIPVHNRQSLIGEAIDSVLRQRDLDIDPIVVDDGSTDQTLQVILKFGSAVTLLSGPNSGVSAARNAGLRVSNSKFVSFLDSDDLIEEDYLTRAIVEAQLVDASMVFGPWKPGYNRSTIEPQFVDDCEGLVNVLQAAKSPCNGSIVWKREFLERIGGYCESLSYSEDHELYFRALSERPVTSVFTGSHYIARDIVGANRLTNISESSLRDGLTAASTIYCHLLQSGMTENNAIDFFRGRIYEIMRSAARGNLDKVFAMAQVQFREIGGRGHQGSFAHIALSFVFGLQRKERVSSSVYRILARLRGLAGAL